MASDNASVCALPSSMETERRDTLRNAPPDTTPGLTVLALLLVLILGLSAADIQRQHADQVGPADGVEQARGTLDGRGKWAGYF